LGISGETVIRGTIRPLAPALDATVTPSVRPRLNVSLIIDGLFGVASGGGTAETEGELRMPMRLNSDDPRLVWFEDPCMRIKTVLYLWARVNLVFASASWNQEPEVLLDYTEGACGQAALTTAPTPPRLLPAPAIASGPSGRLIRVEVEDTAPAAPTPKMQLMVRFWNVQTNQWGEATPLTDGSHAVLDPVAAFVGAQGKALVAWTENTMSLAEEQAAGNNISAILSRQEIYYRLWNGSQWGAAQRLTNNAAPDGRAAIAGDESGAVLAWVRDLDGNLTTHKDWRIEVTQWNDAQNSWGAVQELNAFLGDGSNAQVSATRRNGKPLLAWTADADGELATNLDRQIAIAELDGNTWKATRPSGLPGRADAPAVALDPTGTKVWLSFLVRGKDSHGTDTGIGNQARLWTALRGDNGVWQAHELLDSAGDPVRAERPQIDVSGQGEALVVFRRFGRIGTHGELGQLTLTQLMADGTGRPPLDLTDEAREHWQPVVAIDQQNGQAMVLNVGHTSPSMAGAAGLLAPSSLSADLGLQPVVLTAGAQAVESVILAATADPALDPQLQLSQMHAPTGATVTVSATVRNLGRAQATNLTVSLYAGASSSGAKIGEASAGNLPFNGVQTVTFQVQRASGAQPLYAQVSGGGGNSYTGNDGANGALGELLPPTLVQAAPANNTAPALVIAWQPPDIPVVAGFRILRQDGASGPYSLVGETTNPIYTDLLLTPGATYRYVVQSYDAAGVVSVFSAAVSATAPEQGPGPVQHTIHLPALRR
jgi:hypothetical protein